MNTVTPAIQDLARRLIALEAARDAAAGGAGRACDRLRLPLTRLAGAAGFRSLLSRALALAKADDNSLNSTIVRDDGTLDGLAGDGGAAVVARLLGLLETFIGEPLTRQLVRDAWPDAALDQTDERDGGTTMNAADRVTIRKLPTGVPGLDEILGGGLPEFSFNIIAGAPGGGKTTLAHQIAFANSTPARPALYFTVLGEPAIKMLRYQQQFKFFDPAKVNAAVRFINLSQVVLEHDLDAVLAEIVREVEAANPAVVIVDSFRTVVRKAAGATGEAELQGFVQRLALHLTSWQATTFLIGEYTEGEIRDNPVFTVADGLFWLYQQVERNSITRKLQIMKLRGQASVPGLHTFRITDAGIQAFSRHFGLTGRKDKAPDRRRLSCGVAELDAMMGGGIPEGDSLLIAGPSGTGKSVFATQFIAAGLRAGEPGIVAIFEERPEEYAGRAADLGMDFAAPQRDGTLTLLYLRPLDLSVDETMREIVDAVERTGAKRVVIDSLAGFELALAPSFRTDFRESLYRMIGALTRTGVTIVSTVEVAETFTELALSPYSISFLSDDIVRLRYVEIDGRLRKILLVVKMRAGDHSKDIREYEITATGIQVGDRITGYHGLITGVPEPLNPNAKTGDPAPREQD